MDMAEVEIFEANVAAVVDHTARMLPDEAPHLEPVKIFTNRLLPTTGPGRLTVEDNITIPLGPR